MTHPLSSNYSIPEIGLGTYKGKGSDIVSAIEVAWKEGYRLFDTAKLYANEVDVGKGIQQIIDQGANREEIFVVTKVWPSDFGYEQCLAACEKSLASLGLDYCDLILLHWPGDFGWIDASKESENENIRRETWRALEDFQKTGKVRSIGLSNWTVRHLKSLLPAVKVKPVVNQIEFHPYLYQEDLLQCCSENNIVVMGYTPFAARKLPVLEDPVIVSISEAHNVSPAQVILRWCIHHKVVPIPKSVTPSRIKENIGVYSFKLSDEEVVRIDGLNKLQRCCPDPHAIY